MKTLLSTFLFLFLAACTPSLIVVTQTTPVDIASTNSSITATSLPPAITSSVTDLSQVNTPTHAPIRPKVEIIAPDKREVQLQDLGLSNSTRLILYYHPSDSLRIMSGQDIRPQRIPNINSKGIINYGIKISPNEKWFIYHVFKERREGIAYYDLWISSIDGRQQKIAVSNVQGATEARWVTNEKLELWYYPDGARACPERELLVDPFAQETLIPPTVPPSTEPHCFFPLSTSPDQSKLIYRNKDSELWNIFDFDTGNSQNVFPWLSQSDSFALWPNYVQWLPSGITYVLPNQESIDYALDLSPTSAMDIGSQWNKILLPESNKILWNAFPWVSLDDGLIGFDMIDAQTNPLDNSEDSPSSKFVVLDLWHSILYDYNFDRAKTGDTQRVSDYFVYASADNRFLAWTISRPPGMGNPIETVVLDRKTGRIARVKGFEFLGWGEVK